MKTELKGRHYNISDSPSYSFLRIKRPKQCFNSLRQASFGAEPCYFKMSKKVSKIGN